VPLPSEISFTSFLQYSPRPQTQLSRQSKELALAIKNDSVCLTKAGQQRAIPYSALRLREEIPKHPVLQNCFSGDLILLPAPRSAPLVQGGLWPAMELCREMETQGIASSVLPLLIRTRAVRKSATAGSGQRPGPEEHFDSFEVDPKRPLLTEKNRFVIVDDVVTRGATLFACYARLEEAYPNVPITCFAFVRTMSNVDVDAILAPVAGMISYSNGHLHRHP
jgi:hypothetical protein